MTSLRLPQDIDQRLTQLSEKTGRTKTYYIREALTEHLDKLEDIYLALARLEKPGKRWSLTELEAESDLDS